MASRTLHLLHPTGPAAPRRGSIYVAVLSLSTLLLVVGLSSLLVTRIRHRTTRDTGDGQAAVNLAFSAVEHALATIQQDSSWRSSVQHAVTTSPVPLGPGTFEWSIEDEAVGGSDGDLDDDADDPFRIYGVGRAGGSVKVLSLLVGPSEGDQAIDLLQTALTVGGDVYAGGTTSFIGGPLATLGTLTNNNVINGDVEAAVLVNPGTINGTQTVPGPPRALPPASVFDDFDGLATEIPYASLSLGAMHRILLSAASNPYGPTSADAIYRVSVPPGAMMTISKCRTVATLCVSLGDGATLRLSQANRLEKPASGYPTLLVRAAGTGYVDLNGTQQALSEANELVNFNPPGTPANGISDNDIADTYATEISGLVHVFGPGSSTSLGSSVFIRGTVITDGMVTLGSNAVVTVSSSLENNPPPGYRTGGPLAPAPSSWRWESLD